MKMRKFIVEIHPDGRVTCCEYEEPRDTSKSARLAGYRQALAHCNEQVGFLEAFKDSSLTANLRYQGAAQVRDVVASYYRNYSND
nr:MAG TPA: hypothetical protein [Caudoviricetes sp.]